MKKTKAEETDQTYSSDNTFPIIFMNNIKDPINQSHRTSFKKNNKDLKSIQLPKETLEARDVIQQYYEDHDMKPFFNNRPNYKPNIQTVWKLQKQSIRYSHVKPRIDTNIQRKNNSHSISYSDKSKTIEVQKSNQYRKIISKTRTPNMSLYLQPQNRNRDDQILPKLPQINSKKTQRSISMYSGFTQKDQSKLLVNQSSQTAFPTKNKIISYESLINSSIEPINKKPSSFKNQIKQINIKRPKQYEQDDDQQQEQEDKIQTSILRPRKNSLESQAFSAVTKPNFDINKFSQKLTTQPFNTNRNSTHSTFIGIRNPNNNQITQESIMEMSKQFKPKSDILLNADITKFKIKKYKNGVYFGDLVPNENGQGEMKQGLGCVFYYNGRVYEGEFKNDYKNGKGYELYPNSFYYHGDFKNGYKDGKGVFVWGNGEMYWGQWSQGKKHGSGTWKGIQGSKQSYFGQWFNGKPHGFGVLTSIEGDVYEGQFKLSVKDGKGTQRFINGDVYVGQYIKGRRSGPKQTMFYKNGEIYIGAFCNNVRNGKGILTASNKQPLYQGHYNNDKKCGQGLLWLQNGIYEGNFENDLRHGFGKIQFSDGNIRNGYWVNGKELYENHQHSHTILQQGQQNNQKSGYPVRSLERKQMKSVGEDKKFDNIRKAYMIKKRQAPSLQLPNKYRRACGCLKKHV